MEIKNLNTTNVSIPHMGNGRKDTRMKTKKIISKGINPPYGEW